MKMHYSQRWTLFTKCGLTFFSDQSKYLTADLQAVTCKTCLRIMSKA